MALATLSLFSNRPFHCSSSTTAFLPYSPNPSHSRHQSTFFRHLLQTQPFISPNVDFLFRPSIHCRCSSHTPNVDFQFRALVSLFEEIGISFEETKLLLCSASELISIQPDSLRDRVLSLQSVGLDRMSINYIVTKQLNVLTSNEIDPFLSFLRNELKGQLEKNKLIHLLSANEPKILFDFPQKVQLLLDHGIAADKIVHVLNKVSLSKAICHKSMEEIERMISFLKPFGGVDLIVKQPNILNFDLDYKLKPRIRVLTELSGGDEVSTGKVLNMFPGILNYSVRHVEEHIEFLRSFAGFDDQQIFRTVLVFPTIFANSRDRKLRPRIQFLKECGLDSGDIFKLLTKAQYFMRLSFSKNIAYKLVFLVKIGYEYRTKELAAVITANTKTSCEYMQKVVSLFLNYGLSSEDILSMSKKHPQIMRYSLTFLEKKMNCLIEEMDRDIQELSDYPAFLGYKFDEIKHMCEINKDLWEGQMSLSQLLTVSSENFTGKPKETFVKSKME